MRQIREGVPEKTALATAATHGLNGPCAPTEGDAMTRRELASSTLVAAVLVACGGPIDLPPGYAAHWKEPAAAPDFLSSTFSPTWLPSELPPLVAIECADLQAALDRLSKETAEEAGICSFKTAFRVRGRCPSQLRLEGVNGVVLTGLDDGDKPAAHFDGTGAESGYAVEVSRSSCVVIEGFTITNYTSSTTTQDAGGMTVSGPGGKVLLRRNTIGRSGVRWEGATGSDTKAFNAHGILVKGSAGRELTEIAITGNRLYGLRTGYSEALTVTCNVRSFDVHDNILVGVDNIGIDIAGFHSDCGGTTPSGGRITGNTLSGQVCGNPSYRHHGEHCNADDPASGKIAHGAGIYIDGGRDTEVKDNRVDGFFYGIELGGENRKPAEGVTVLGNKVTTSDPRGCPFLLGASSGGSTGTIGGDNGGVEVPGGEEEKERCVR